MVSDHLLSFLSHLAVRPFPWLPPEVGRDVLPASWGNPTLGGLGSVPLPGCLQQSCRGHRNQPSAGGCGREDTLLVTTSGPWGAWEPA